MSEEKDDIEELIERTLPHLEEHISKQLQQERVELQKGFSKSLDTLSEKIQFFVEENTALRNEVAHLQRETGEVAGGRGKLTVSNSYQLWYEKYMKLQPEDQEKVTDHIKRMQRKPLISLVVPTYNTAENWLRKMIESVTNQLYPHWELCIADDCSPDPLVREILEEYAAKDERIKLVFRKDNGHISLASNSAMEIATGEFIAFLDHDDELTIDSLYHIAAELEKQPDLDMIYSDSDKIDSDGNLSSPYFKSEWNPDLMMSHNVVCHFAVFRKSLIDNQVGGLKEGYEGAQDWDFVLRFSEATSRDKIARIPRIIYHWRMIAGSTSADVRNKSYAIEAGQKSVEAHVKRAHQYENLTSEVEHLDDLPTSFRIKWRAIKEPKVSLIILTRDGLHDLKTCINSIIERTSYFNYEIIIVDNGSVKPETLDYLRKMEKKDFIKVQRNDIPFNFSQLNNEALPLADGEIIGLVNNDIEVISPEWLREMVGQVLRPQVGAVGARLLYPNGTLQHGGLVIGIQGLAGHASKGVQRGSGGYFNRVKLIHTCSGVTAACMLVRKEVYNEVGGLDQENLAIAFNDVDFCLKIREVGYDIVYTPYAELYHHESKSRGYEDSPEKQARFKREMRHMHEKWNDTLNTDPFYNPNLTYESENFSFTLRPRWSNPWEEES